MEWAEVAALAFTVLAASAAWLLESNHPEQVSMRRLRAAISVRAAGAGAIIALMVQTLSEEDWAQYVILSGMAFVSAWLITESIRVHQVRKREDAADPFV
jgi:hypothetical protein